MEENFKFIAPEAEILVVDDNEPNLVVVEGILSSLQMKIDKAISGRQAFEMAERKRYDLIFMDHVMPEMDGVETVYLIRRNHREYDRVPIIAMVTNVMEETLSMFQAEGINDYLAKPIEQKTIVAKIREWLPPNKIKKAEGAGEDEEEMQDEAGHLGELIVIPGLDVKSALNLMGSTTLFWEILKEYAKTIPKKSKLIQQCLDEKDWRRYTIEVHALKSFSRQVGALELAEQAAQLEKAGNNNDVQFILAHHDKMMERYLAYETVLEKYVDLPAEGPETKEAYDAGKVGNLLAQMQEAIDNLDMDAMEDVSGKLCNIELPGAQEAYLPQVQEAVENMDVECCETIIREWKKHLE